MKIRRASISDHEILTEITKKSFEKITLDSEPNAENFYLKIGFKKVGEFETSRLR